MCLTNGIFCSNFVIPNDKKKINTDPNVLNNKDVLAIFIYSQAYIMK